MRNIDQRRPSRLDIPHPNGLWSLWDMLNHWGYRYLHIGMALAYAEVDLQRYRSRAVGIAPQQDARIEASSPIVTTLEARCDDILKMAQDQELGAIPNNVQSLKAKIAAARKNALAPTVSIGRALEDIERIKNDFVYILSERLFYSLVPARAKLYGKDTLFGPEVAKKFPLAGDDIEAAGNCLALGEPTACVLHLNRALEIATRRLAKKLHITLDAKDSWGMVLGKMTEPIKDLPDNKPAQKQKKERWAECRTNLYHVKMAWRDPGSHGTASYSDKQAEKLLTRVDDFMQQLSTLL
jgi:hypothetical protein